MISGMCNNCNRRWKASDEAAGKVANCKCGQPILVDVPVADILPTFPLVSPAYRRHGASLLGWLFNGKNEPWYYGYCYRMTLILLGLSLFGVFCVWLSSTSLLTMAMMPTPKSSHVADEPPSRESSSRHPDPASAKTAAWLWGILLTSFWAVLSILWMLYFAGLILIFIDASRWVRRYCSRQLTVDPPSM